MAVKTLKAAAWALPLFLIFGGASRAADQSAFDALVEKNGVDYESYIPANLAPPEKPDKAKTVTVHSEVLYVKKNGSREAFQIGDFGLKRHAHSAASILDIAAEKNNSHASFDTKLINHRIFSLDKDSKTILQTADVLTLSNYPDPIYKRPLFDLKETDAAMQESKTIIVAGLPNFTSLSGGTPGLSLEGFNFLQRGDTVIRVSSVENADNDTSPDVVYPNAFTEGFCYPFVPSEKDLRNFFRDVGTNPLLQPDAPFVNLPELKEAVEMDIDTYRQDGGKNSCYVPGNSFASPNLGGLIAGQKEDHLGLHEFDVTAAILLSSQKTGRGANYKPNARKILYSDMVYGHGKPDGKIFANLLDRLEKLKTAEGLYATKQRPYLYSQQTPSSDLASNEIRVHIDESASTLQTMGFFTLSYDPASYQASDLKQNPQRVLESLPRAARITSPAGTTYEFKLHAASESLHNPKQGIKMGFASTAFLGEDPKGDWNIEIPLPAGSNMKLLMGEITIAGVEKGGPIDRLIDEVSTPPKQEPQAPAILAPIP